MPVGWEFESYDPVPESVNVGSSTAASQGGPQIPKRQVHSNACQACRDRKSKCNNDRPICRSCIVFKTSHKCNYDPDNDLRRKAGLRREVEKLKNIISKHAFFLGTLAQANSIQVTEIVGIIKEKKDINEILKDVRAKNILQRKFSPALQYPGFHGFAPKVTAPVIDQNGMALSIATVEPITMPVADRNDRQSITVVEETGMMTMPVMKGQSAPAKVPVSVSHYPNASTRTAAEDDAPSPVVDGGDDGTPHHLSRPVVRVGFGHWLNQINAAHLSETVNDYVPPPYSTSSRFHYGSNGYSDPSRPATDWNQAVADHAKASTPVSSKVVDPNRLSVNEEVNRGMDAVPWSAPADSSTTAPDMLNSEIFSNHFNPQWNTLAWNPAGDSNETLLHPRALHQNWDMNYDVEQPDIGYT